MGGIAIFMEQQQAFCLLQQRGDRLHVPRCLNARTQGRDKGGQRPAKILRRMTCHCMLNVWMMCIRATVLERVLGTGVSTKFSESRAGITAMHPLLVH